jgi:hypothetical protein
MHPNLRLQAVLRHDAVARTDTENSGALHALDRLDLLQDATERIASHR